MGERETVKRSDVSLPMPQARRSSGLRGVEQIEPLAWALFTSVVCWLAGGKKL